MKRLAIVLFTIQISFALDMRVVQEEGAKMETARRWDAAEALYADSLSAAGVTAADQLWLRMSLAEVALEKRDYPKAARWLVEAESSLSGQPVAADVRMQIHCGKAALLLIQGKLSGAEDELTKAHTLLHSNSPSQAALLHTLAGLETQMGRLPEAEHHQRMALELLREQLGASHRSVMKAWISLSTIQGLRGDWKGAEQSLRQSLAIEETPEALSNYALVLGRLKRRREAKALKSRGGQVVRPNAIVDVKAFAAGRGSAGLEPVTR